MIVLHYTAMTGGPGPAIKRLCDPKTEVSCHYVIGEHGEIARLVPDDRRAWHAGAGHWGMSDDINSRSLGIELSNDALSPFPAAQMAALEELLSHLMKVHKIPAEGIIGHSDCAPGRKIDPGGRFDWRRLALCGLAVWPDPGGVAAPDTFADQARAFGYTAPVDAATLLAAFRLRFRPGARGPLDEVDAGLATDLARRFPVDLRVGAA
ncbi:N-acetylmuramoyl-L-alanine amidase [Jannaschia sp. S6380]|uniref:N-acetylmuramoyl-L-alanine amidase n=1 Tax=Jannaschia sp. S6380 TaxID=2926408 RepID=UPI001FF21CBE|nr:N-acetylmuramoyl-L-alanine amidase [Jannaschia sp. S6380]MCK0167497.1 N-acetylmuramoyl-L-alanine amidase [Jannaschia sp. S6380]